MEFTQQDKQNLIEVMKKEYNKEQLSDFIAHSITEESLMILSTDFNSDDIKNIKRKAMIETLKELREHAINRLKEINNSEVLK